jgi:hypothetical protein
VYFRGKKSTTCQATPNPSSPQQFEWCTRHARVLILLHVLFCHFIYFHRSILLVSTKMKIFLDTCILTTTNIDMREYESLPYILCSREIKLDMKRYISYMYWSRCTASATIWCNMPDLLTWCVGKHWHWSVQFLWTWYCAALLISSYAVETWGLSFAFLFSNFLLYYLPSFCNYSFRPTGIEALDCPGRPERIGRDRDGEEKQRRR